nr:hypothetical protein Itr_chr15CG10620 [Ipomoea trifida]
MLSMKLTRILRVREEAGHSRRPPPVPRAPYSLPWTPSASSTSLIASPMAESLLQSSSATSSVPPQSPIASPRASSPSEPVVPSPTEPEPSSYSPFLTVPAHFIKVTDWEIMQIFQYQLHLESLNRQHEWEANQREYEERC